MDLRIDKRQVYEAYWNINNQFLQIVQTGSNTKEYIAVDDHIAFQLHSMVL